MLLAITISWVLYSILEGFREGYYWFYNGKSDTPYNFDIHPYFSIQRAFVLVMIYLSLSSQLEWWQSCIAVLSMMLMFSFFHNGMYYTTRNKLNSKVYTKGWFDQSNTSTAKMTKIFTPVNRTIALVVGILGIISLYFI